MIKLNNYPRIVNGEEIYVRFPVKIEQHHIAFRQQNDWPMLRHKVDKWMAVNVLENGYSQIPLCSATKSEKLCIKSCEMYNEFYGFTKREVHQIISTSMMNSLSEATDELDGVDEQKNDHQDANKG